MKIYTIGCSFTYGDELSNPTKTSWPALLQEKYKCQLINDAVNGGSNQRTVYRLIKSLQENFDLSIVAWTTYSRFTFYKSNNNNEVNFNPQLNSPIFNNNTLFKNWGETLYRVWYNELYAFKLWLQQIIQLQSLLKHKNYLMINTMPNQLSSWLVPADKFIESTKHMVNIDHMNDEQLLAEYREIQYYVSLIDTTKFYKWADFAITELKSSFETGPGGHILEKGHAHLANLIYNHINVQN